MKSQSSQAPRTAIITYCLSEAGRKAAMEVGGSGAYHQNVWGPITLNEQQLFDHSSDGVMSVVFNQVEFDEPQNFEALLTLLRARQARLYEIKALIEAEAIADQLFHGFA
jgi:hypothetical protein